MNIASIIIGAVVAIAAYALGHYSGENRGKALGWLERNQQAMDDEARSRAADGKFRSVRKGVPHG